MTSFDSFYETWFDELHHLVDQLAEGPNPPTNDEQNHNLLQLVKRIMTHFAEYYRVKSLAAQHDVFSVFSAPWSTSLERSLHWVGGWRPTIVFHLVYTESSILFESHLNDILHGIETGDLGDLSPGQMQRFNDLQCETVREENDITTELSQWQDGAIDLIGVDSAPDGNTDQLLGILEKADGLRLRTVTKVVELFTPQQAAEFLTAAAGLQFGVRGLGVESGPPPSQWECLKYVLCSVLCKQLGLGFGFGWDVFRRSRSYVLGCRVMEVWNSSTL